MFGRSKIHVVTAMETRFNEDKVLFSKRSGLFGMGTNRYTLTEHGFLKIEHGLISQTPQSFDLQGSTYEKGSYNALLGRSGCSITLREGYSIKVENLYYRGFRDDFELAHRNAQLEHREPIANPRPTEYRKSKAGKIIAIILLLAFLALLFVPKLVGAIQNNRDAGEAVTRQLSELTVKDIKEAVGSIGFEGLLSQKTYDNFFPRLPTHQLVKQCMLISLYLAAVMIVLPPRLKKLISVLVLIALFGFSALALTGSSYLPEINAAELLPLILSLLYQLGVLGCSESKYIRALFANLLLMAVFTGAGMFLAGQTYMALSVAFAAALLSFLGGQSVKHYAGKWCAFACFNFTVYAVIQLVVKLQGMSAQDVEQLRIFGEAMPIVLPLVVMVVSLAIAKARRSTK